MTHEEAKAAMTKRVPVIWNAKSASVSGEYPYAFITSIIERYDEKATSTYYLLELLDKNRNHVLKAPIEDVRCAEYFEILKCHGFEK